jgi:hypothetical protein
LKILITSNQTKASLALAFLLKAQELVFGTDFSRFPAADSESLAHEVLAFCLDHQITDLYPTRKKEVNALLKASVLFAEYDIAIHYHQIDFQFSKDTANNFADFSIKALKLGYPKQKIAIGLENQMGKILVINDDVKDFNQFWYDIEQISFVQVGKLFNSDNFEKLSLFKIDQDVKTNYLLVNAGKYQFFRNLENRNVIVSQEGFNSLKEGFYTLYTSGDVLLRLSNF